MIMVVRLLEKGMELEVLQQLAVRTARYPCLQSEPVGQIKFNNKQCEAIRLVHYPRIRTNPIQQATTRLTHTNRQVPNLAAPQELPIIMPSRSKNSNLNSSLPTCR